MRYRNFVLFMLLAAVWGSAFMAIKAGLEFFPPVLFAALRYDIAGVLMLGYAVAVTDDWLPSGRGQWTLVAIGSVFMIAGYHVFLFVGELQTTPAAAAVIVSLSPVLTAGFARLFLPGERISVVGTVGMFLGLVGVVVLAQPDPNNLLGGNAVGEFLVLAAAASFALGSVLTRRVPVDLAIEPMEAWSMLGGALLMHLVSIAMPSESLAGIEWTTAGVTALLYLSLASSALGFLIYFDLLERLGPIEINLVSYVAPIFAAISGWLVLGDETDLATVVGFVVIFTGFALLKRRAIARELPKLRAALRVAQR